MLFTVPVALRKESVDRNLYFVALKGRVKLSLSARRAWIEMFCYGSFGVSGLSLSARRAWIEIITRTRTPIGCVSLSARRAWIEITAQTARNTSIAGRSPQGERG